ncbi:MAG TPA: hypothetical protein VIF11_15830 [Methylomirabilota bacterium]
MIDADHAARLAAEDDYAWLGSRRPARELVGVFVELAGVARAELLVVDDDGDALRSGEIVGDEPARRFGFAGAAFAEDSNRRSFPPPKTRESLLSRMISARDSFRVPRT